MKDDMNTDNVFSRKTILVTGATGLIGSNLINALLRLDCASIIVIGRDANKMKTVFGKHIDEKRLKLIAHDISNPLPEDLGVVHFVFHAASPISGKEIGMEPVSVLSANLRGTLNCLDFLVAQKKYAGVSGTFIVFSSATVYGRFFDEETRIQEHDTSSADRLDDVQAVYSESKRMNEVIALSYMRQFMLDVRIARFAYVYGDCVIPPKTAFYEFVGLAVQGKDMVFSGSGFARRDNIYAEDAIVGLLTICERGKPGEAYNVSSGSDGGNFAAIDELADVLAQVAKEDGNDVKVVVDRGAKRKAGMILDNSKLKALGWRISTSLVDGVRIVYARCKSRYEG